MRKTIWLASSLNLSTTYACAQDWSFEVEAGMSREPAYVGSDTYITEPDGNIEATYTAANGVQYIIGLGGLGTRFRIAPRTTVELTLEYEPGRENDDDPILAGFPEMEDTWEAQAVVMQDLGAVSLGFGLQTDLLNRGKGTVGFVGMRYDRALTQKLTLNAGFDLSFANAEHMNTEVGISPTVAAATGLAAYDAPGGYKGATLSVGLDYNFSDRVGIYSDVSFERYGSAIADSPLVRTHGSSNTTEFELGVRFSF